MDVLWTHVITWSIPYKFTSGLFTVFEWPMSRSILVIDDSAVVIVSDSHVEAPHDIGVVDMLLLSNVVRILIVFLNLVVVPSNHTSHRSSELHAFVKF